MHRHTDFRISHTDTPYLKTISAWRQIIISDIRPSHQHLPPFFLTFQFALIRHITGIGKIQSRKTNRQIVLRTFQIHPHLILTPCGCHRMLAIYKDIRNLQRTIILRKLPFGVCIHINQSFRISHPDTSLLIFYG